MWIAGTERGDSGRQPRGRNSAVHVFCVDVGRKRVWSEVRLRCVDALPQLLPAGCTISRNVQLRGLFLFKFSFLCCNMLCWRCGVQAADVYELAGWVQIIRFHQRKNFDKDAVGVCKTSVAMLLLTAWQVKSIQLFNRLLECLSLHDAVVCATPAAKAV